MASIDLNGDMGEGIAGEEFLMPLLSSANIACGGHAGDEATMRASLELARRHGVAPGAHPGYEDRANFGRVELRLAPGETGRLVEAQLRRLAAISAGSGLRLTHVKPHGALYNQAARDPSLALEIAGAVLQVDPGLVLFALAGSELVRTGRSLGLRVAEEAFADRAYLADGSLAPRSLPGAVLSDPADAVRQALGIVLEGRIRCLGGAEIPVRADTLCLHGDGPAAAPIARALREAFSRAGVQVRSPFP